MENIDKIREINEKLTKEEMILLKESREKKIVFDEDCPETTPKQAIRFHRVNPLRRKIGG